MIFMKQHKLAFVDLETTGLDPSQNEIVEVSGEKPPAFQVLGWNIDYADDLPSGTAIDRGERRILVRWSDASESARARQAGILAVAREEAFVSMMRETNTKKAIEIFSKDPDFTRELLRFRGAKILRDRA